MRAALTAATASRGAGDIEQPPLDVLDGVGHLDHRDADLAQHHRHIRRVVVVGGRESCGFGDTEVSVIHRGSERMTS